MGEDMKHSILFIQKKKHCMKGYKNKRGVTLIELIVTFALISLFTVLSCQLLSTAFGVFYRIQYLNYGMQVSDTLMDKIGGEIEGALVGVTRPGIDNEPDADGEHTLIIRGDSIDFYEKTGSHIKIRSGVPDYKDEYVDKNFNQLVIHYYGVTSVKEGTEVKVIYDAVDWTFDKKMYLGYQIKELKFTQPKGDYEDNIIKVELEISHSKYGEYKSTRYVECYNFQTEDDFKKIHDDGSESGGGGGSMPTPNPTPTSTPFPTLTPSPEINNSLEFTVGNKVFVCAGDLREMLAEAKKEHSGVSGITVPGGYTYKEDNRYIYIASGNWYEGVDTGAYSVVINQTTIYQSEEIRKYESGDHYWVKQPQKGDVVYHNGKYYVAMENGIDASTKFEALGQWKELIPK